MKLTETTNARDRTFAPTTDGYVATSPTLTVRAKLRLVAVDKKARVDLPDFKIMLGLHGVGAAWKAKSHEANPREYLNAVIDDPMFAEPLRGALFEENGNLNFIWRRKV